MSNMLSIQEIVYLVDYSLNSKRKRHITGGILISIAALFAGLAITTMTVQREEDKHDE